MADYSQRARCLGLSALLLASLCAWSSGQSPTADQFVTVQGCRLTLIDDVKLASERRGILAEIVAPGARIAVGGNVARLRDSVLKASLALAQREAANDIEVRFAQKAAELAALKHERALMANQQSAGTVSDLELKELRLSADRAALQYEQAEHGLAMARLRLEEMRASFDSLHIVTPFAAQVRAVYKQPGEVVQEGEAVAEVVNTDRIRVEGDVNLIDLPFVAPQTTVQVRIEGSSSPPELAQQVFSGSITFVDVKVEPVSQKVHIAAELDNSSGLLREGLMGVMFIMKPNAAVAQR